ncbi:MAG: class I SAM-dependent methyltransferase, partial [Planctomycetales bacterium]
MRNFAGSRSRLARGAACLACWAGRGEALQFDPVKSVGLHGGLIIQVGAEDTRSAEELSLTGRYLIHVLDTDADRIRTARSRLRRQGRYGLAWAEQRRDFRELPYAENMVNLIVVPDDEVPVEELRRVLIPGGSLILTKSQPETVSRLETAGFRVVSRSDSLLVARKPRSKTMDAWSHPRHAADGNAVSQDTEVGPPKRVRWIAAATSEVEGMVSAGGRNFYGGILAR